MPLKIWAVWVVFQQDLSGLSGLSGLGGLGGLGGYFGKTAQTAQILLKKPLKNRSFLAVTFERFSSKIWAVFKRFLSGLIKKTDKTNKKAWKSNVTPGWPP